MRFKFLKILLPVIIIRSILIAQSTGNEWIVQNSPTKNTLRNLHFIDSTTGWAAGASGTIIHTVDGGDIWNTQTSNVSTFIHEIFFLNKHLGWALTIRDTPPFGTSILKTTNGGDDWIVRDFPVINAIIYTIFFFDSLTGFIGGRGLSNSSGNISHTLDGGETWLEATIDSNIVYNFPVYNFNFYSRQFGYACGGRIDLAGVLWKTTDYGLNWVSVGISPDEIFDIFVFDSLNALSLSGDPEGLFGIANIKTSDAGITWCVDSLEITGLAFAIDFRTSNEGWSASGEKFLFTSDRGESWIEKELPNNANIYDIQFLDARTGYAVGDSGTVLKLDPTAVKIKNELIQANEIMLHQNYPNPFNPVTNIEYRIAKTEFVKLKVYSVLGDLVATLINEEQPAGTYEVVFNGAKVPSGIYFYQLRAGDFVQTKKMIYLK